MSNTISAYSNFAVFVLQSEFSNPLVMYYEPTGWDEGSFKIERHKDYHGMFTSFTNLLSFRKQHKDYIINEYELRGINANLRLLKFELKDIDGEVKFVERYSVLADYKTMKIQNNSVEIRFNSNELEEIIKSHKSDTFEIERLTSIDDDSLEPIELNSIELSGRTLSGSGESDVDLDINLELIDNIKHQKVSLQTAVANLEYRTAITKKISEGPERFSTVSTNATTELMSVANMFFINNELEGSLTNIEFTYNIKAVFRNFQGGASLLRAKITLQEWDGNDWFQVSSESLGSWSFNSIGDRLPINIDIAGSYKYDDLKHNQGVAIVFYISDPGNGTFPYGDLFFSKHNVKLNTSEFYENSPNLSFVFFHDAVERLMYILTGKKGLFYSKYFGRTELGYAEDGEGGLIGLMSGFWARNFDPASERYKSLQTSLNDEIRSAQAVFNIGVGIEKFNLTKKLRFEKLSHFYRDEVVVKFPNQLKNVVRTIDANLFFSGTTIGFERGGEYDENVGLDEPNTTTETVTPIRKSDKKFRRVSKTRSDDYGLELARRIPQFLFPDKDSSYDDNNWWLDIKRTLTGFTQKIWSDRLTKLPTGVNAPENYKGMFFTPLRMLLRHGFVLRAGLEPYLSKLIKNTTIKGNKNLRMQFIGDDKEYGEGDDILTSDLDRAKFLPTIIKGEHTISTELLDWIQGSTKVLVNGEYEYVPNVYFPMEFLNENEEYETGYLLLVNPKGSGQLSFQKINNRLLTN
mgnify:CR=1 FL=1